MANDRRLPDSFTISLSSAALHPSLRPPTGDRLRVYSLTQEASFALNHPNILVIHEIGTEGNHHSIASEVIEGETLRQHMHRRPVSVRESLDIATQAAGALSAAHKAGIVHRDVKPENIMIRPDGYVKVLDFGLAKLTKPHRASPDTEAPSLPKASTDPGTVMGTVNYRSPEQARGKPVDARSDLFSLGLGPGTAHVGQA